MGSRLFLGIRVGQDVRPLLKNFTFTSVDGKLFCGRVLPPQVTLKQLHALSSELAHRVQEALPDHRLTAPVVFPEFLIG